MVPPGYDGPLPEGGFYTARAETNYVLWFARTFLENKSDPKPVAELQEGHQGLARSIHEAGSWGMR